MTFPRARLKIRKFILEILMITPAILYQKKDYHTNQDRLMGRQSATEGFLKGLAQASQAPTIYCYSALQQEFDAFCEQINQWTPFPRQLEWLPFAQPSQLEKSGLLYRPDPILTSFAWQRRYHNQRAYSLCGITHTIASKGVLESFGDLLIAPLQPWDGIICTSKAVKTVVENVLENWGDYLQQKFSLSAPIAPQIKLPVIPLGIDSQHFNSPEKTQEIKAQLRQKMGIEEDDIVVLFVGRLIFHAKAHPVPMYMALERATQITGKKVHLIQAGWFEDKQQETGFNECAKLYAPSVNHILIDGRHPGNRQNIWSAADIFISLADNIQETFGLTPIEAMANGLPVVVSDWNGYQETVVDGVEGFKVKTVIPPQGSGLNFIQNYGGDLIDYSNYIAVTCMTMAVDIPHCIKILVTLFDEPELRAKLGANGRRKATEIYDWQVIIKDYEALWLELEQIRLHESEQVPLINNAHPHPILTEPFTCFQHYATAILDDHDFLYLSNFGDTHSLKTIAQTWFTNCAPQTRLPPNLIEQILRSIAQHQGLTVKQIIDFFPDLNSLDIYRTLVYLLKFDIIKSAKTQVLLS